MKTFRTYRTSRTRRLPALCWVVAWLLLVTQGAASAAPQCGSPDTASSMEFSMPEMTDHSAMHVATQTYAHTAADCPHCHHSTQGGSCPGLHDCQAQLAAVIPTSMMHHLMQLLFAMLPAALAHIATLPFDPPLRPSPA